jgi:hypothetical protein
VLEGETVVANEGEQDSEYREGEPVTEEHVAEQPLVAECPEQPSVLEIEVIIAADASEGS